MGVRMRSYAYLSEGRNRRVFLSPNGRYVIKVPKNDTGYRDNVFEHRVYRRGGRRLSKRRYARCRIHVESGILVMERVCYEVSDEVLNANPWTMYVDCAQVGWTHDGRLVAYDYA